MYLERVKAKGRYYLYLKKYDGTIDYSKYKKVTLYSFGRLENAVEDMRKWKEGEKQMPSKLKELGCTRGDLHNWIETVERKPRALAR